MLAAGRTGAAVVAASPSGLTGVVAEMQAIGKAIRESVSGTPRTPLMEAMAAELMGTMPDKDSLGVGETPKNMDELKAQSIETVRQAVWLVSSKLGADDVHAYQQMLTRVAENAANAAKEGGFLGMGGEQVNDKERAILDELRGVIGGGANNAAPAAPAEAGTNLSSAAPVTPAPDGSGNSN